MLRLNTLQTTRLLTSSARMFASFSSQARIRTPFKSNVTNSLSLQHLHHRRPVRWRGFFVPTINRITMFLAPRLPASLQKKLIFYFYFEEAAGHPIISKMTELEKKIQKCKNPKKIDELTLQKVELLNANIQEHAIRRVELFFHLLIAVWNKQITITKEGGADYQHGIGSKEYGTAACHSNPFTNLTLTSVATMKTWFTGSKASLFNADFIAALNATMELPVAVNDFDTHFEGAYGQSSYIKEALEILNKCARGEINPITGLQQYLEILNRFFNRFEQKYIQGKNEIALPDTMAKIWEMQRAGTFSMCYANSTQPRYEYLAMILGMSNTQVRSAQILPLLYNKHVMRKQQEMYTDWSQASEEERSSTNTPPSMRKTR